MIIYVGWAKRSVSNNSKPHMLGYANPIYKLLSHIILEAAR